MAEGETTIALIREVLDDFYDSEEPRSYRHALDQIRLLVQGHSLVEDVAQVLGLAEQGLYVATGADNAVLQAIELVSDGELSAWAIGGGERRAVGQAEIDRRAAKRAAKQKDPADVKADRCPGCNRNPATEGHGVRCPRWLSLVDKTVLDACANAVFHKDERGQYWLSHKEGTGFSERFIVEAEIDRRLAKGLVSDLSGWEFSVHRSAVRRLACPECSGMAMHTAECSRRSQPLPILPTLNP